MKTETTPLAPFSHNSHIHLPPNFSAFDTVGQAVGLANEQGLRLLGASNYYDYSVYSEFQTELKSKGIRPLFGLEIIALLPDLQSNGVKLNDPGNPGKMYICGKGISRFDPFTSRGLDLLNAIRDADSARMREMVEKMSSHFASFGYDLRLTESSIKERIADRHGCDVKTVYLQERHVAQAFQEVLFERIPVADRHQALGTVYGVAPKSAIDDAVGTQNDIRSNLIKTGKPAYAPETFVGFEHARDLILELGGIPCYPVLADGANPITPFEGPVETLIGNLKSRNIHAAEFIPLRNRTEVLDSYVRAMRSAGLIVTAGTEHNTLDLLPLIPECLNGDPVSSQTHEIFCEGACVALAHQTLVANGEAGYVDANGNLNTDFSDPEERINHFRKIGEALL